MRDGRFTHVSIEKAPPIKGVSPLRDMGAGVAASKTLNPKQVSLRSLMTHAVFGIVRDFTIGQK
jgi:hypothetical protein